MNSFEFAYDPLFLLYKDYNKSIAQISESNHESQKLINKKRR